MTQDLQERFHYLVEAELPRLRRFAFSMCEDWHRADDYVQAALERMYMAWPKVHDISHPGAYLRTILVRQMLNEWRRPWRREHSTEVLPEVGYETTDDAVLVLDLARALRGLSRRQRAAVILRYVEDRSVAEVAQIMGTTPGTVKRHCSDAVVRLRHILGEDFTDDRQDDDPRRSPSASLPVLDHDLDLDVTRRGVR
ncbi:SigE family RNA polymerase sigma factor [Kineosporia succinea]|uniref:RNA polymerase sigma-70 factor (Sigma-E family) n=1 Tax=Kineosporia succinea TaxID=84632 RepID=A0ABT9P2L8_9ACTN|nr:SigE family RNA polymerase sigma factor [Kineosporia succinea]MDP9826930.1 RNA polymerase sigma-70 factor (sigma-E family) [Kineosporia succinea]